MKNCGSWYRNHLYLLLLVLWTLRAMTQPQGRSFIRLIVLPSTGDPPTAQPPIAQWGLRLLRGLVRGSYQQHDSWRPSKVQYLGGDKNEGHAFLRCLKAETQPPSPETRPDISEPQSHLKFWGCLRLLCKGPPKHTAGRAPKPM